MNEPTRTHEPAPPQQLADSIRTVMQQGERAMLELGWTFANVKWREDLDALLQRALHNDRLCDLCYEHAKQEGAREARRSRADASAVGDRRSPA